MKIFSYILLIVCLLLNLSSTATVSFAQQTNEPGAESTEDSTAEDSTDDSAADAQEDTVAEGEDEEYEEGEEGEEEDPNAVTPAHLKTGGYFSVLKLIFLIGLYLLWVKTGDWISIDAVAHEKNWRRWNPIFVGAFCGTFVLALALPWFWLGYLLLLVAYFVPFVMYVLYRNEDMNPADKVFTVSHIRHVFAETVNQFGVKVSKEAADRFTTGSKAILKSYTKSERQREIRKVQAHAHEGFMQARQLFATVMVNHPESVILDYSQTGVAIRFLLDGVWHLGEPMEREKADPALEALKLLCGMNPQDRKTKQQGECAVEFTYTFSFPQERLKVKVLKEQLDALTDEDNDENFMAKRRLREELRKAQEAVPEPVEKVWKTVATITSQGVQTGERVLISFVSEKPKFDSLSDIGMRPELAQKVQELFNQKKGILLFSAPPANGLRTTINLALSKTDRFQREYYALEQAENPHEKIENVTVDSYEQKDELKEVMKRFFLKEPDVAVIQDMSADIMAYVYKELLTDERLIVTSNRSKEASDAILRFMAMKNAEGVVLPVKDFAGNLVAIVCQRLIRKLCDHCKQRVQAPAQLAQQMGAPAGKPFFIYQPPTQPLPEGVEQCPECHGIGYKGRTAITEVFFVGPAIKEAIMTNPKLETIRKAARKDGAKSMMEEGLVLVSQGITSVAELKRILEI